MVGTLELETSGSHYALPYGISTPTHGRGVVAAPTGVALGGVAHSSQFAEDEVCSKATQHRQQDPSNLPSSPITKATHDAKNPSSLPIKTTQYNLDASSPPSLPITKATQHHQHASNPSSLPITKATQHHRYASNLASSPVTKATQDTTKELIANKPLHTFIQSSQSTNQSSAEPSGLSGQERAEEYKEEGKVVLSTDELSRWIGDRQRHGLVLEELRLLIPIVCASTSVPTVLLEVLPRATLSSRSLRVRATLTIPARCSKHKWLVQYADSALRLTCSVTRDQENAVICTKSAEETISSPSEVSQEDHVTVVGVDILEHHEVLYASAKCFALHIVVAVVIHGFHDDQTASAYRMVDIDGDKEGIEIVRTAKSAQQLPDSAH